MIRHDSPHSRNGECIHHDQQEDEAVVHGSASSTEVVTRPQDHHSDDDGDHHEDPHDEDYKCHRLGHDHLPLGVAFRSIKSPNANIVNFLCEISNLKIWQPR